MRSYYYLLFVGSGLLACNSNQQGDIPGIYVRAIRQEYATGSDTLVITLLGGHTYQIEKHAAYRRIRDGKELSREHTGGTWTGVYDETENIIREPRQGKILVPLPKENKLLLGTTVYKKVKQ